MRRPGIWISIAVCLVSYSHGDPCEYIICENPDHECRPVQTCDVKGSCDMALAACGQKDDRYIPCAHGLPVVDLIGQELLCGSAAKCPFGFHCQDERCCPMEDFGQAHPPCIQDDVTAIGMSSPRPTMTFDACVDLCHNHDDCHGSGQLCCMGNCSTQCQKQTNQSTSSASPSPTPATAEATMEPVPAPEPNVSTIPVPNMITPESDTDGSVTLKPDDSQTRPDGIDTSEIRAAQSDSKSDPQEFQSVPASDDAVRPGTPSTSTNHNSDYIATPRQLEPETEERSVNNSPAYRIQGPQKAGRCPNQPKLTICGQPSCSTDGQCPGPTKCCPTHCGRICVTPQETSDRLNRLQPNIFQDIGFREPRTIGQQRDSPDRGVIGSTFSKYGLDFALLGPAGSPTGVRYGSDNPSKSFGFGPQRGYAGLYKPEDGPLYSYGFRPGAAARRGGSSDDPIRATTSSGDTGNVMAPGEHNEDFAVTEYHHGGHDDNSIPGYQLPFSHRPRPFPENSKTLSSDSISQSRFEFPSNGGTSRGTRVVSFPGYGANGFTNSRSASDTDYGRLDPGRFGRIGRSDYEKLGFKYPDDELSGGRKR